MSNRSTLLLEHHLKELKLPTFLREYHKLAAQCASEGADHPDYLLRLAELELIDRHQRMVERRIRAARFPAVKSLDTFDFLTIPSVNKALVTQLARCEYIEHRENVIAIGNSGTGKTHALCALGHRLVEAGHSVLFAPAYRLVQELLAAKRDLDLPRQLRKLDNFDFLLLDDLGYLPQGTEESEVLFTLIAERYERRSLGITSNLVFSEWERIFANPMATAAAIDRVVHHSVILEFDVPSYRTNAAQQRVQAEEVNRQN